MYNINFNSEFYLFIPYKIIQPIIFIFKIFNSKNKCKKIARYSFNSNNLAKNI